MIEAPVPSWGACGPRAGGERGGALDAIAFAGFGGKADAGEAGSGDLKADESARDRIAWVGASAGFVAVAQAVAVGIGVGRSGGGVVVVDEGPDVAEAVGCAGGRFVEDGARMRGEAKSEGGNGEEAGKTTVAGDG